ncbi:M81 family metallopeptidase [Oerskovia flava]|uniref:M81 family metallopeptidase n=1 Tax=Oerskovia flava TaxID=2986422 RepID=UPI00223EEBCE|nr:M81 family metallopeptidase [Oerskovia sp. JB1-3-2]
MTQPLASAVWSPPLGPVHPDGLEQPRIAIAGIAIESSTFSPHVSGWEAFRVRRGSELLDRYEFLAPGTPRGDAARWVPLLHGRSLPGGAVDADVYRAMRDEIVAGIVAETDRHGPLDGMYLDLHGAMSVVGMADAEADLATAVRAALGPDTLVSASMDLHGNVSAELAQQVDLLTCYRMAPHEDEVNTRERAVHHLLERLRGAHGTDPVARRPWQAWVQVPVLLPGEKTSTRIEPALGLYERVPAVQALDGVLDAGIWIGYAWADEPRCQAAVVVTGDDQEVIAREARELAEAFWAARRDFAFVAPALPLDRCLDVALGRPADAPRPFVVSDSGDNPTAGGAGDVTWTLGELLEHPRLQDGLVTVVHASVFDPAVVAVAEAAGVGGHVDVHVGGRVDGRSRGPVRLAGEVYSVTPGDPDGGTVVVIRRGGLFAIVTERRKPYHHLRDFTALGIDPHRVDVLVVKIGYLEPELYDLAADWRLALTPGGVDQDLLRLGHREVVRPLFPFDPDMADPDLTPVLRRRGA